MPKDAKGHGSYPRGERTPLPGHAYHGKTDAELRFIMKDASEAGRNAQGMGDHRGVNKYADQVNDAATILGHRGRMGSGPINNSGHAVVDHPKSGAVPTHDGTPSRSSYNEHGSRHGYNPDSVNTAIKNNRTGKIGGREASAIHRLLKGR